MKAPRETWLDSLKGFAILLVILGHVLSGYMDAHTFSGAYASFYHVRTWIYSFHMPLFFLVSGFTFTLAYTREGELKKGSFLRQLVNIFWIYVLFALLQWWVKQIAADWVNQGYTLETLQKMFVEPLGNYWYLYVLFVFYALGALLRFYRLHPMYLLFLGGCAISAAAAGLQDTNLTLYRIAFHGFFFLLGSVLCRHRWVMKNNHLTGVAAIFLASMLFFYIFRYSRNWYPNWKFFIAVCTCVVNVALFLRVKFLREFRIFQVCGKYCLELYLLHTFFTAGLRSILPLWGITTPWLSVWVNFLLSTGVCLLLAWLSGKCWVLDLVFRPTRFAAKVHSMITKKAGR